MGTVTKGKSYKYTLCTGHLDLIIVTIAMAKGCVLHYLSVIAVLSLSLLNQGWGVPKHYLVETKDGDNNVVGTQDEDNNLVGTQDDDMMGFEWSGDVFRQPTDDDLLNVVCTKNF